MTLAQLPSLLQGHLRDAAGRPPALSARRAPRVRRLQPHRRGEDPAGGARPDDAASVGPSAHQRGGGRCWPPGLPARAAAGAAAAAEPVGRAAVAVDAGQPAAAVAGVPLGGLAGPAAGLRRRAPAAAARVPGGAAAVRTLHLPPAAESGRRQSREGSGTFAIAFGSVSGGGRGGAAARRVAPQQSSLRE